MGHPNEQKGPTGNHQGDGKKVCRMWHPGQQVQKVYQWTGRTILKYLWLKCVGNLKSRFQNKFYRFFFFSTETFHGTETASSQRKTPVLIRMWSHKQSFSNLAGLLAVTFPTPPRGPGNSVRLAAPEVGLIRSFSASLYARNEGNGGPWAVILRCCREFWGRLTDDLQICKLFKIWFAWIWKEIEKKIQRGGELSFLSYCNYTHEMKRNDWNSSYIETYFPVTWVFKIIRSPNGFEFSFSWLGSFPLSLPSFPLPSASLSFSFLPFFLLFLSSFLSFSLLLPLPPFLPFLHQQIIIKYSEYSRPLGYFI